MILWAKLRPNLEEFGRDKKSSEEYDSIEARLEEITRIDAGSFAFGYPVDTSGQASFPRDQLINLGNVRAVVNAISNLLEGVSTFIHESLRQRWEMEANYDYDEGD